MPSVGLRKRVLVRSTNLTIGMEPPYLVKDMIPAREMTLIYGNPKSGKSFVALDLAWHVATGTPYHGLEVKKGPVLYLPFEGHRGIPDRLKALEREKGPAPDLWTILHHPKVTRMEVKTTIEEVRQDGVEPVLIIFDTLNRSIVGGENDDEAMGPYVDQMQRLVTEFDCAVLIIHHEGHVKGRPRGHTLLPAAIGCQIRVWSEGKKSVDKVIFSRVEFMKDGPDGDPMGNHLRVVNWLQPMPDGSEMERSTCVLDPIDKSMVIRKVKKGTHSSQRNKALKIAQQMQNGADVMSMKEWEDRCIRKEGGITGPGVNLESTRRAFRRAVINLEEEGYIIFTDDAKQMFRLGSIE